MSENKHPLEVILKTCNSIAHCMQTHLANLFPSPKTTSSIGTHPFPPPFSVSLKPSVVVESTKKVAAPLAKEELGRATWTLLHTIGAQFPDNPTRQQKRDVKELMAILSRIYPCKECADHFKEVLKANPVQAGSQAEFSQWLCHVHNVVNRSLGKQIFPCQRVDARWGKMDCEGRACDLQGSSSFDS